MDAVAELKPDDSHIQQPSSILVVDDDPDQLLPLALRLEKLGYRVWTASRGHEALRTALAQAPDLIVLDLQLPDLDGWDVCAKLADEATTCATPIIILSGMEREDVIRRSRAAGCQFYVRKPYDPNALLALIQHSLQGGERGSW